MLAKEKEKEAISMPHQTSGGVTPVAHAQSAHAIKAAAKIHSHESVVHSRSRGTVLTRTNTL